MSVLLFVIDGMMRGGFGDVVPYDNGHHDDQNCHKVGVEVLSIYCASIGLTCVAIGCIGRTLEMGALCYYPQTVPVPVIGTVVKLRSSE